MNRNKLICILLVLFSISFSMFSANATATVSFVRGKAEVNRNNQWVPLKIGDSIYPEETLSTGFQSEIKIKFNNSVMALGALTRVTLEDLSSSSDKDSVSVFINSGSIRSRVSHTDAKRVNYTVKSPVAVASVRGTDFIVTASGTVKCMEGAVAVYVNTDKNKDDSAAASPKEEEESDSEEEGASEEKLASTSSTEAYVPANATTPASEISESAPVGAVVVAQNQQVSLLKTGLIDRPVDNSERSKSKIINSVTTAATTESVAIGNVAGTKSEPTGETAKTKASAELKITVKLAD
ncbi:MAG: FecR domain-containing protein [Treponema sp.]|nr:FecR domain-containing protein [Treponema sp.]